MQYVFSRVMISLRTGVNDAKIWTLCQAFVNQPPVFADDTAIALTISPSIHPKRSAGISSSVKTTLVDFNQRGMYVITEHGVVSVHDF